MQLTVPPNVSVLFSVLQQRTHFSALPSLLFCSLPFFLFFWFFSLLVASQVEQLQRQFAAIHSALVQPAAAEDAPAASTQLSLNRKLPLNKSKTLPLNLQPPGSSKGQDRAAQLLPSAAHSEDHSPVEARPSAVSFSYNYFSSFHNSSLIFLLLLLSVSGYSGFDAAISLFHCFGMRSTCCQR